MLVRTRRIFLQLQIKLQVIPGAPLITGVRRVSRCLRWLLGCLGSAHLHVFKLAVAGSGFFALGEAHAFAGLGAGVLLTVFVGSAIGTLVGIVLMAAQRAMNMQLRIPFGPFLAIGAITHVFWGADIVMWYLGLTH